MRPSGWWRNAAAAQKGGRCEASRPTVTVAHELKLNGFGAVGKLVIGSGADLALFVLVVQRLHFDRLDQPQRLDRHIALGHLGGAAGPAEPRTSVQLQPPTQTGQAAWGAEPEQGARTSWATPRREGGGRLQRVVEESYARLGLARLVPEQRHNNAALPASDGVSIDGRPLQQLQPHHVPAHPERSL